MLLINETDRPIDGQMDAQPFLPRDAMHMRYMLWPRVSLSQDGVLLKQLNTGSHKQKRTIAQGL